MGRRIFRKDERNNFPLDELASRLPLGILKNTGYETRWISP
jgi:hypothetical protein